MNAQTYDPLYSWKIEQCCYECRYWLDGLDYFGSCKLHAKKVALSDGCERYEPKKRTKEDKG